MDDYLNVTYITLRGYVEMEKYRYLYFTIMILVYILIICSNATIVYLIWSHKNLHEPMYIFIGALLFNCVIYSMTFYPKLLTDFLSEKQVITYSACVFQFFMFYSVGGSEFLLLAVMAFDRYVSICKPLRYPTIMRKILIMAYRSTKTFKRKVVETCLPHLLVLISFSYLCIYDIIIARVESDFPKIARFIMTLQLFLYHPLLNPIIYGLKMKEISKHLKRLFCSPKV
ncbi:LOW QUALITY PROTEIN: putative olfactory receptor 13C6 [Anableps anableps]